MKIDMKVLNICQPGSSGVEIIMFKLKIAQNLPGNLKTLLEEMEFFCRPKSLAIS